MSRVDEVVCAFFRCEAVEDGAHSAPCCAHCSFVQTLRAACVSVWQRPARWGSDPGCQAEGRAGALSPPERQCGRPALCDCRDCSGPPHRPDIASGREIARHRHERTRRSRVHPARPARRSDHGAPVAIPRLTGQAFPFWGPAAQRCQVGIGQGFVDKDEAGRVDPALIALPARATAAHIRAGLSLGELGRFLNASPLRSTKAQTVL
jgi:hypothetical protein